MKEIGSIRIYEDKKQQEAPVKIELDGGKKKKKKLKWKKMRTGRAGEKLLEKDTLLARWMENKTAEWKTA